MSTILDALKKSEQERKLNNVPTLSDMPAPQEANKWSALLWVIIALLVVTIAVILGVWKFNWFGAESTEVTKTVISNQTVGDDNSQQSIPADQELVVNVVSYSEDESQRFVMINGRMFREDQFVKPGVKIESIKPDSVVINERGKRATHKP